MHLCLCPRCVAWDYGCWKVTDCHREQRCGGLAATPTFFSGFSGDKDLAAAGFLWNLLLMPSLHLSNGPAVTWHLGTSS